MAEWYVWGKKGPRGVVWKAILESSKGPMGFGTRDIVGPVAVEAEGRDDALAKGKEQIGKVVGVFDGDREMLWRRQGENNEAAEDED